MAFSSKTNFSPKKQNGTAGFQSSSSRSFRNMLDLCHLMNGNSLIRSLLCLLCCRLVLSMISGLSLVYNRKIVHPLKIPVILKPPKNLKTTVDGRNPAPPGVYKTLQIMGETTNLNRLAVFLPSTVCAL